MIVADFCDRTARWSHAMRNDYGEPMGQGGVRPVTQAIGNESWPLRDNDGGHARGHAVYVAPDGDDWRVRIAGRASTTTTRAPGC